MHGKGRTRGKVLRYIKNPSRSFFRRANPESEVRAIKGQHHISKKNQNRRPQFPESTIPEEVRPDKDIE